MLHHVKRNRALHEIEMLLTIKTEHVPTIEGNRRWELHGESKGFYRVIARYGYMEEPDVAAHLHAIVVKSEPEIRLKTSPLLSRPLDLSRHGARAHGPACRGDVRFSGRQRLRRRPYFRIPAALVVELGNRIDL